MSKNCIHCNMYLYYIENIYIYYCCPLGALGGALRGVLGLRQGSPMGLLGVATGCPRRSPSDVVGCLRGALGGGLSAT